MSARHRHTTARARGILTALAVLSAAACNDQALQPYVPEAGELFARYVAMGNSITAGFESGGINDSTQQHSYAVLLAEAFGLEIGETFSYPSLAMPGCPPPLTNVFTQTRVAPGLCFTRSADVPPFLNNVAVPGAAVLDLISNLAPESSPNALTTFFLGGRTQVQAAREIDPTFVTIWIGNNDILGALFAADAGGAASILSTTEFADRYSAMMDSVDALGTVRGGVLIGVVQVLFAPYATSGPAWAAAAESMPSLTVADNCLDMVAIPGSAYTAVPLVPFHVGAPLFAAAAEGTPTTVDCSGPEAITADEAANMFTTVAAYNVAIAEEAEARGWVFWDPNELLSQVLDDPAQIRPFPAFDPADPQHESAPFGTALSLDGIHPSAAAHALIAQALGDAIDDHYGANVSLMLAANRDR
jgi:lysophospholipase L1-like esterase